MMIHGFTQTQVIGVLATLLITSYAVFFGWAIASIRRLNHKIDAKASALDAKLSARIDELETRVVRLETRLNQLETRVNGRIEALAAAVSRLEGAVYNGTSELGRPGSDLVVFGRPISVATLLRLCSQ